MFKVEKTSYGIRNTFTGIFSIDEVKQWISESKKILLTAGSHSGVFVDMRGLKPLTPDAQNEMQEGQKLFKQKGMERSVVILDSATLTIQFKRIAKETGIYQWERYIDASSHPDFEKKGIAWLKDGIDPDK